jgi:outer membrane protein assembly factor BamE (lipoprotein component of BamABCDE complex)
LQEEGSIALKKINLNYKVLMPRPLLKLPHLILFILLVGLGGCQARIHETGTVIRPEDVNKIVVGVTNFREVRKLLGPATIVNSFRQKRWIYIQDRRYKNIQRTFARSANRIEITFNSQGIVEKLERNFGETLLDPENDPDAELKSRWGGWFWKGEYDQPDTSKKTTPAQTDEAVDGEAVDGEAVDGETVDVDVEVVDVEVVDVEVVDVETIDGETVTGETVDGETVDGETVTDKTVDGETTDGEAADSKESQEKKSWWRFW